MGIDDRLMRTAEDLARQVAQVNVESLLQHVFAQLDKMEDSERSGAGRMNAASTALSITEPEEGKEESSTDHALAGAGAVIDAAWGCPADARRIAELLEPLNTAMAAIWWVRAAELGDEDAKDYVEVFVRHNGSDSGAGGPCPSWSQPSAIRNNYVESSLAALRTGDTDCSLRRLSYPGGDDWSWAGMLHQQGAHQADCKRGSVTDEPQTAESNPGIRHRRVYRVPGIDSSRRPPHHEADCRETDYTGRAY